MKNPHIIVGEPQRCICGQYESETIYCGNLLSALSRIEDYAQTQLDPSLFIRKGERVATLPPTPSDLLMVCKVIKSLVEECSDTKTP